jgi:ribosomal peptide maturation radical SAM protein 1
MRPLMLIAAPWALFNRPSIQVASLKAFVQQRFPQLPAQAAHLHLETAVHIGYRLYQKVSEKSWVAEAVAASLLYPENSREIEELFLRESAGSRELRDVGLARLASGLNTVVDRFLDSVPWSRFGLVGFSVSLCQTTSSLLLISRLKARHPFLPVVVGGSTFAGEHPETLSKLFPGINHLVRGEGENSLADLVAHYCQKDDEVVQAPPQLPPAGAIADLDTLPSPDFGEYFLFLKTLPDSRRFFPVLPLEMSRGCRWQARYDHQGGSENSGRGACAFCNLNLQWQGYRHKSATKVAAEISLLTKRHQVLSLAFMDNLLPPKDGDNLMRILGGDGQDLQIFAEIRADTTADRLHTMYRAGVRSLQVGIEALSSTLLEKMGKGTSVMDNIEMMRHCEALGIPHGGNLLLRFPGSDEDDVAQTLANMRRVWVFRPLQAVHFWLGLHSPVHDHPTTYNITPTGNHRHWKTLLGKRLAGQLQLLIQGYRGQQRNQQRLWSPVASALKTWQRSYSALSTEGSGRNRSPILSYQDGGDFLILSERKIGGDHLTHRLPSASRRLYLYCRTSRSRVQLQTAFAGISSDRLDGFLAMMVDKGLMFEENMRYLSLAVPIEAGEEQLDEIVSGVKG